MTKDNAEQATAPNETYGLKGRVLLLSNCALDPTLGSGKTRLRWSDGLRGAGFTVQSFDPEALTKGLPECGGVRFRLAIGARLRSSIGGFDLVECYGAEFGIAQRAWFRGRRSRPLIVAHTDGLELLDGNTNVGTRLSLKKRLTQPLHHWLNWSAFRCADALVAGCQADIRFARANGLFRDETAICINVGVDPEYLGLPFKTEREHLVIYFGTWSKRKAPERIVRVMSEVLAEDPTCRFEILGAAGAEQEIFAAFPQEFHPRMKVHPKLPTREVAETLLRAKVMFFPSHYEGFGMATSESMACGCAVVVTPTGFGADLRDGVDAFVRDFQDESGMRNSILDLLRDDKLRIKISRAGWERVQSLSWENQCRQLVAVYDRWLKAWDSERGQFNEKALQS